LAEHRSIRRPRVQVDQIEVAGEDRQRFDAVPIQCPRQARSITHPNFVEGLVFDDVVHG